MKIVDLASQSEPICEQAAARLLVDGFHEPHGWPNLTLARDEVSIVLRDGFARAMLEGETVAGWVGGIPNPGYEGRVWELHPMVVKKEYRRKGVGRALVGAFEVEAGRRGAITVTLGTDDHTGMTSLSEVDLYSDIPSHLARIADHGRGHPFLFYRRVGFVVTGVMPDANGPGKPDIYMSKRVEG